VCVCVDEGYISLRERVMCIQEIMDTTYIIESVLGLGAVSFVCGTFITRGLDLQW
jgi:hypothetical protein